MAIVPMKHIEIIALQRDAKKVVELLQREGVVDLSEPETEAEGETDSGSELMIIPTSSTLTQLDRNLEMIRSAIASVEEYSHTKTSILAGLSGRKELTLDQFSEHADRVEQSMKIAYDIDSAIRIIENETPAIMHVTHQLNHLLPLEKPRYPDDVRGNAACCLSNRIHSGRLRRDIPSRDPEQGLCGNASGTE